MAGIKARKRGGRNQPPSAAEQTTVLSQSGWKLQNRVRWSGAPAGRKGLSGAM